MENEFKTCPNCGELGEWIDVRTERVFGEDPGTMYVQRELERELFVRT